MSESINRRIIDKINDSKYDKNIKDFLKSLLLIELTHLHEGIVRYSKEYDRSILRFMNKEGQ